MAFDQQCLQVVRSRRLELSCLTTPLASWYYPFGKTAKCEIPTDQLELDQVKELSSLNLQRDRNAASICSTRSISHQEESS